MDSSYKLYLERSQNELRLAQIIQKVSDNPQIQVDIFKTIEDTYYSGTISHAYYAIFFAAKAYLLLKEIKTKAPEEHKKTFIEFSKLAEHGIIDDELLAIYQDTMIKADQLLHIFELEKGKRGKFTYKRLPQANQEPAQVSMKNARLFVKNISLLCNELDNKNNSIS